MPEQLEERVSLLEAEVERIKNQISVSSAKPEHPMLKFAGIFKDDPDLRLMEISIILLFYYLSLFS